MMPSLFHFCSNDSFPHFPHNCTKNILNFYMNPDWRQLLERVPPSPLPNATNITEVFDYLAQLSPEPCQKELFDLPFYYLGMCVFKSSIFLDSCVAKLSPSVLTAEDIYSSPTLMQ